MARLFIGQREVDFISDITKEVIKDVVGQKIYYYTVREDLSNVHEIYEESIYKIFNPPVEIECMIEWKPSTVKTTKFGHEQMKNITAHLHPRDLIDRNIDVREGDYFSFGENFFEISSIIQDKIAYGQVERAISTKLNGIQTRIENINQKNLHGPKNEFYTDTDAIQTTFEQQRGTTPSDKRQLVEDGILDKPIGNPRKVAPDGSERSVNNIGSTFYGDD
jgi:hypothetical protein